MNLGGNLSFYNLLNRNMKERLLPVNSKLMKIPPTKCSLKVCIVKVWRPQNTRILHFSAGSDIVRRGNWSEQVMCAALGQNLVATIKGVLISPCSVSPIP